VSTEDGFYSHKMLAKLRQAVEVIVFPFTWADLVGGSGPVARPSLEQSLEQSAAHAPN
jgi:hypothetical protein